MELRSRKTNKDVKAPKVEKVRLEKQKSKAASQNMLFTPFGLFDIVRFMVVSLILASIMSYLTTDTLFYNYQFPTLKDIEKKYFSKPISERKFTIEELSQYDGSDPEKPIYLAVKGRVYDVSSKPSAYGKKGGYSFFSGKDASRSYGTGCFKTHLTHDLRGLNEKQLESINGWVDFYEKHADYDFVGTVKLPKPTGPIPPGCTGKDGKEIDDEEDKKQGKPVA